MSSFFSTKNCNLEIFEFLNTKIWKILSKINMVFGNVSTEKSVQFVKLKGTNITGNITNAFASIVIEQKFRNIGKNPEKCTLRIDGGMEFIVYNVKVLIGPNVMNFVLREIEEAQQMALEYQKSGRRYGYGEMNKHSSDVLVFELGNIPGYSEFVVHIETSFVGRLNSNNSIAFKLPHDKSYMKKPISLDIDVTMDGIESVEGAKFEATETGGKIKIDNELADDIIFNLKEPLKSSAVSVKVGEDNYVGIAMVPEIDEEVKPMSEYIILIDCSGSMSGTPIKIAKEALEKFLNSIPDNSYFNVIRFGSDFRKFFESPVQNTKENLDKALKLTKGIDANLGGTYLLAPFQDALNEKGKDGYIKQIFIITDGCINDYSEQSKIMSLSSKNRNTTRCFALGIGDGVSKEFIEEFAKTTGGNPLFTRDVSELTSSFMYQLSSAALSAVTNVQIHSEGCEAIEIAPFPIPPLFSNKITCIFAKHAVGGILVEGKIGDNEYEESIEPVESKINIDKMFAFFNIRDLEETITFASSPEEKAKIKENVVKQSLMNGIVSQFTALVNENDDKIQTKVKKWSDDDDDSDDSEDELFLNERQFRGEINYYSNFEPRIGCCMGMNRPAARASKMASFKRSQNVPRCAPPKRKPKRTYDYSDSDNEYEIQVIDHLISNSMSSDSDSSNSSLDVLIKLQNHEGYWSNKSILRRFAKCEIELEGISGKELYTVYAIAILLIHNMSFHKCIKIAFKWLQAQNQSYDWKMAVELAKQKILSNK